MRVCRCLRSGRMGVCTCGGESAFSPMALILKRRNVGDEQDKWPYQAAGPSVDAALRRKFARLWQILHAVTEPQQPADKTESSLS